MAPWAMAGPLLAAATAFGLDHVPIAVNDLEAAAAAYRRLGFVLKPGRPHANGIRNVHAKFADGTELERLSTSPDDHTCARLSPDGTRMVYLTNLTMGQDDIVVADSLARNPVNVTNDAAADGWPVWTPDGSRIVYASGRGSFSLWSMNPNGSERKRLTSPKPPLSDARPSVSPDGKRIVFNRAQGKTIGIWVLEL